MLARDGAPAYVPLLICDHVAGEIAAGSILAALAQRTASGTGCSIEVPMFETMSAFVLQEHLAQHSFDPPVGPPGDLRLLSSHNKPVRTADGWIAFTINTDPQVRAFLKVTDREDVLADPRFTTVAGRARHVAEWFAIRGAPLTHRTTAEWLERLRAADIAAQPCHTLDTLPSDPHLQAVGLLSSEIHPTEGRTVAIRSSIRFDSELTPLRSPASPRGTDTREILTSLGYASAQVDAMLAAGAAFEALGTSPSPQP
jgi:crotonobetainyl-CoA:carnitine CoA-transferase CaiB-like acyl-CoA transferase